MRLCSIASGSSGNCIYVGSDHTHLMVDAGISGKRIEQGLNSLELSAKDMDGILITHEHVDHVKGLGVMARKYALPIYATKGTLDEIRRMGSLGVIPDELYREIHPDEPFAVGDLTVKPMHISHDAADPVAYRVEGEGKSAGIVTDLGKYDDYIVEHLKNLNAVVLEANHDIHMLEVGPYPYPLKQRVMGDKGHLSNELSGRLLCDILHDNLQSVILGHLSKENNYAELAYETVKLEIRMGDNPYSGEEIPIIVAKRDTISDIVTL